MHSNNCDVVYILCKMKMFISIWKYILKRIHQLVYLCLVMHDVNRLNLDFLVIGRFSRIGWEGVDDTIFDFHSLQSNDFLSLKWAFWSKFWNKKLYWECTKMFTLVYSLPKKTNVRPWPRYLREKVHNVILALCIQIFTHFQT